MHKASLAPYQRIILILGSGILLSIFFRAFVSPGMTQADNGITIYSASRLLEGTAPYSGTWYPLMPGALAANALALMIQYSVFSVLALEIAGFVVGAFFIFLAMQKKSGGAKGAIAAAFILLFYCLALTAMSSGNIPQTWVIPISCIFVFLLVSADESRRAAFLAGLSCGIAALVLPGEIFTAFIAIIFLKRNRPFFAAGILATLAFFAVFIAATGAAYFVHCVPAYYLSLISKDFFIASLDGGVESWIKLVCMLAPLVLFFVFNRRNGSEYSPIEKFYIAWMAIEIVFALGPEKMELGHLIPALVPISCLWRHRASNKISTLGNENGGSLLAVLFLISFLTISTHAVEPLLEKHPHDHHSHAPLPANHRSKVMVEIIKQTAQPGEPVFVWSDSAETNFLSRHPAPTSIPIMSPLLAPGYGDSFVDEYIEQIETVQPRLMVLEASVLPAGVSELLDGLIEIEPGTQQEELLTFLQGLLKNDYKILTVKEWVVLCVRKDI